MSVLTTKPEVITNQPSARNSEIPPDGTDPPDLAPPLKKPMFPENGDVDSQNPHQTPPTEDDQLIGPLNSSDDATISLKGAKDAPRATKQLNVASEDPKTVTNSPEEAVTIPKKSYQSGPNKNSRNYNINGPGLNPGAGSNFGLSLCLMQFCNVCTTCFSDCCNEYYNWCCCCCTDAEIFVSCCTGCMECCAQCDCGVCCN